MSCAVKKRIITNLVNGMMCYREDETIMRNGCLNLCQFRIPNDMIFEYERLVIILIDTIIAMERDSFIQRIGIYLLNSLACQVDTSQKARLGELGVIQVCNYWISNCNLVVFYFHARNNSMTIGLKIENIFAFLYVS